MRYKPEGPEAKAWREVAERLESTDREYHKGLCLMIYSHSTTMPQMSLRLQTFRPRHLSRVAGLGYCWWPLFHNKDHRGKWTDRITAAWLLYWMAREEGK